MSKDIFKQGGSHKIRKTGIDKYSFSISIPEDKHGRVARKCPNSDCSPGYFKIKPGTGITEEQANVFCPYCKQVGDQSDFTSKEQVRYGKDIVKREAISGIQNMMKDALGLGSSGNNRYGGGMISMEMSYEPRRLHAVRRPVEEEMLRVVVCPHCSLDHVVYGLAMWCPDCGKDIFMTHVEEEYSVINAMLHNVEQRRKELGPRIAARNIENCLEDTVSIFEAVLKALLIRHLHENGKTEEEIQDLLNQKIRNSFQNPEKAIKKVKNQMQQVLFENITPDKVTFLINTFEKRHPITHNLGVMDRKYVERALTAASEGREIYITNQEIIDAIDICFKALIDLHSKLF